MINGTIIVNGGYKKKKKKMDNKILYVLIFSLGIDHTSVFDVAIELYVLSLGSRVL